MTTRKPIAPERDELKACLQLLALHPRIAWARRLNSGATVLEHEGKKRIVRFGWKGAPDIIGQTSGGSLLGGRFFAWECKAKGKKPTEDQLETLANISVSGGYAGWGTAADLERYLRAMG